MYYLLVFLFIWLAPLVGQEPELPSSIKEELERAAEAGGDSRFMDEFLNMLITLGVVIAGLFILKWIVKRMNTARVQTANDSSNIKILDHRTLSQKSSIYVVEIYGKRHTIVETLNGVTELNVAEKTVSKV